MKYQDYKIKNAYRKWMLDKDFYLAVVVQPTKHRAFSLDEITQRMRIINFKLNKHYLKKSFAKWDTDYKFWMVGFREGSKELRNIHYHFLVHRPKVIYKNKDCADYDFIENFIHDEWNKNPSVNQVTHTNRYDLADILHVSKIEDLVLRNNTSAVRYSFKDYQPNREDGQPIFIGLKN